MQVQDCTEAQAAAIGQAQHQAVAVIAHGGQQTADLVGADDHWQFLGFLGEGDVGQEAGAVEDVGEEEWQGTGGLIELAPGDALGNEVQLELADTVGAGLVGRAAGECTKRTTPAR